jgi:hypothetical protein
MSGRNAYFQLVLKEDGTYLKLIDAEPGGLPLGYDEITNYLIDKKIYDYDKIALGRGIATLNKVAEVKLTSAVIPPQDEFVKVTIDEDRTYAG